MFEGSVFGPFTRWGHHLLPTQQIWWRYVDLWRSMPPKLNSKQRPLASEFYSRFQFRRVFLREFFCVWSYEMSAKWYTDRWRCPIPNDPLTTPSCLYLSQWAKCQTGNTQNGSTVLPIANLMADSVSGRPDSYSSFLVTIRLSLLVLEIFACDTHTDGQRDNADHYYRPTWPPHRVGPANNSVVYQSVCMSRRMRACSLPKRLIGSRSRNSWRPKKHCFICGFLRRGGEGIKCCTLYRI